MKISIKEDRFKERFERNFEGNLEKKMKIEDKYLFIDFQTCSFYLQLAEPCSESCVHGSVLIMGIMKSGGLMC